MPVGERFVTLTAQNLKILLGTVVKVSSVGVQQHQCVMVRVRRNEFNRYFKMYFAAKTDHWAWDKNNVAGLGDTVLIKQLQEPLTRKVLHGVDDVVFKHGRMVDPVTQRRVIQEGFADTRAKRSQVVEQKFGPVSPLKHVRDTHKLPLTES